MHVDAGGWGIALELLAKTTYFRCWKAGANDGCAGIVVVLLC